MGNGPGGKRTRGPREIGRRGERPWARLGARGKECGQGGIGPGARGGGGPQCQEPDESRGKRAGGQRAGGAESGGPGAQSPPERSGARGQGPQARDWGPVAGGQELRARG